MDLKIKITEHNSEEYRKAVELRRRVLRIPLGLDFTEAELQDESDQIHIIVASGDHVVASLSLVKLDAKTLKMRQVAVDPQLQGNGIGSRLVSWTEIWAAKNDFKRIVLHARETAVKFYEDLAYTKLDHKFLEVGIPHYKMFKDWNTTTE